MKNFSKPCYDFAVILYDFFYFCAFFAPSVNAPSIFQNLKYKTSVTRNYLQNAANRNSLRRLVLSNNVKNFFSYCELATLFFTSLVTHIRTCIRKGTHKAEFQISTL